MLKLSHAKLITLSGLIWFAMGFYLLYLGLHFLMDGIAPETFSVVNKYPMMNSLASTWGSLEGVASALIALGLLIGYMKGRYVLSKAVGRSVGRILALPNPAPLSALYDRRYLILLAIMMGLGISLRIFSVPLDIRGFIDVAIGAALINGAMLYFRQAAAAKKPSYL